jgi:Mg-chelatase subunit ChlD
MPTTFKMRLLTFSIFFTQIAASVLVPRAASACTDLNAKSNNGNRKMAIVIDDSGSMSTSDPMDLRYAASKRLISWLLPKSKGSNADLVAVIDFNDVATLDYPLGDPAGASGVFDSLVVDGGTYIAGGVDMAISQLTVDGSGTTDSRSGIVVFTDGEVGIFSKSFLLATLLL